MIKAPPFGGAFLRASGNSGTASAKQLSLYIGRSKPPALQNINVQLLHYFHFTKNPRGINLGDF